MGGSAVVKERWETKVLGWLEHPANLMLANLVWFLLVLPLITWFPATVALASSVERWLVDGDPRVMRNVLHSWRQHWRRTLPLGLASTVVALVLAANALFLSTRGAGVATVLLGATGVLGAGWLAVHLWLVIVIARDPDGAMRGWFARSAALVVARPFLTASLLVFVVLLLAVLVGFWTFVPFFGANLVVWLVSRAAPHADEV